MSWGTMGAAHGASRLITCAPAAHIHEEDGGFHVICAVQSQLSSQRVGAGSSISPHYHIHPRPPSRGFMTPRRVSQFIEYVAVYPPLWAVDLLILVCHQLQALSLRPRIVHWACSGLRSQVVTALATLCPLEWSPAELVHHASADCFQTATSSVRLYSLLGKLQPGSTNCGHCPASSAVACKLLQVRGRLRSGLPTPPSRRVARDGRLTAPASCADPLGWTRDLRLSSSPYLCAHRPCHFKPRRLIVIARAEF